MNIARSVSVPILILALTVASWAAKKQGNSPVPERSAVSVAATSNTKWEAPAVVDQTRDEPAHPQQTEAPTTWQIPWQSVNGGGAPMTSTNYQVNASVGQSAIGFTTSTDYQAGVGYWYGTSAAGGGGCSCPFQCDYDADGFLTALDLGSLIDVLFAGKPEVTDPDCPTSRGDFDCDSFPTALDLGKLIDHLFAGGLPPCDPCSH